MKILLIQPPVRDFYRTEIRAQPIGLAYLAAYLLREGFEAEILDAQGTKKKHPIEIPDGFKFLKQYYSPLKKDPFKLFTHFYHFGLSYDEIKQIITQSKAEMIGISAMFTPYVQEALEVAKIAKSLDPHRPVIVGGAHVSSCPERVLESDYVDFVIMGEGEERLSTLMDCLWRGRFNKIESIDGLGYKLQHKIKINPAQNCIEDLDSLPFPSRHLLNLDHYRISHKRLTMLITSRGCPHSCRYCSVHLHMGKNHRKRSPTNVLAEIVECYENLGIPVFDIEDDNFTFDKNRAEEILDLILKYFGPGKLTLMAMNGLSAHSLDENLLRKMRMAGFNNLNLSLASNVERIRQAMDRPGTNKEFSYIINQGKSLGFQMVVYSLLGLPNQTIRDMLDSLLYTMEMPAIIGPSIFYPVPGTDLFKECLESDLIKEDEFSYFRSMAFPVQTAEFSRQELITLFQLTRMINYVKGILDSMPLPEIPEEELSLSDDAFGPDRAQVLSDRTILNKQKDMATNNRRRLSGHLLNTQEFFSLFDESGILESLKTQKFTRSNAFKWILNTPLTQTEIGLALLFIFFKSHIYHSLVQTDKSSSSGNICYTLLPVNYSERVILSFFEQAKGKRISATSNEISLML